MKYIDVNKMFMGISSKSSSESSNITYIAINNLRKICNHPFLFF